MITILEFSLKSIIGLTLTFRLIMKKLYAYLVVLLSTAIFLFAVAFTTNDEPEERTNKDIIMFSHSLHAELSDCESCHTGVAESLSLSDRLLPEKDACAMCHDVEDMDACGTCHYEDVYEPMIQKKSKLLFSHKFHIDEENLECMECHKGFEEIDYSFQSSQANPPMMQCYSCHNDNSVATNACEACHISTVDLLPDNHKTASFFKNHKFTAMAANADCAMCHDNVFCEDCHVSTNVITETNLADNFYTPYSPHTYIDNEKKQVINRVHDLNYRFLHGIDAKGKTMECQTCHETETFCAACHASNNEDFASSGILPASHLAPNFVMIGVGSGGGEHSRLARRDIERCASCHDVQGADANCIMCHVDPDGIKGTNPKTHTINFMSSTNGDWHNDAGSVCYNCHTDANAYPGGNPNFGFCGYCHNK